MGSIGKNDSNREMNLRAKPNVMNQLINHRACDKMKGHNNVTRRMVITKARAMTCLGGKLKLLFIRNALFSLFIYALLYKVIKFRKVSYAPLYKVIKVESVMASLWELGPVIFGPTEDFVSWLQNKGLLASSRTCSSCSGAVMRLGKRGDVSDGCVWRCPQCKTTKSICEGSFFTKSRMPLKKWLLLLHCWVRQYPAKDAAEEAEVDPNTACDIYRYFFGGSS